MLMQLKYLVGDNLITFGEWMAFGVPSSLLRMALAWLFSLIGFMYKADQKKIELATAVPLNVAKL